MREECRRFESGLEAFLDGTLTDAENLAAQQHLRSCSRCRELADLAGAAAGPPGPDIAAAILESTSGTACGAARERMCDLVDGRCTGVEAELLTQHTVHCEDCAVLATVLVRLSGDLPLLAELPADEGLTTAILVRTSGERSLAARPSWAERLVWGWQTLTRRPRFALEGAYVLTVLLLGILGLPGALLADAPTRAAQAARREIVPVQRTIGAYGETVADRAERTLDATGARLTEEARTTAYGVTAFSGRVIDQVRNEVGTFWSRFASGRTNDDDAGPSTEDAPENEDGVTR